MTPEQPPYRCPQCNERLYYLQQSCLSCERTLSWDVSCVRCGSTLGKRAERCSDCGLEQPHWRAIERQLGTESEPLRVAKDSVDRPMRAGYNRHIGSVKGQWADYRRKLGDGREAHVRTYGDHYELHLDTVGALDSPGKHAVWYAPRVAADGGIQVIDTVHRALSYSNRLVTRLLGWSDDESDTETQ